MRGRWVATALYCQSARINTSGLSASVFSSENVPVLMLPMSAMFCSVGSFCLNIAQLPGLNFSQNSREMPMTFLNLSAPVTAI
jgi:hypothetical protein